MTGGGSEFCARPCSLEVWDGVRGDALRPPDLMVRLNVISIIMVQSIKMRLKLANHFFNKKKVNSLCNHPV